MKPETWNLKAESLKLKPETWNLKPETWNLKPEYPYFKHYSKLYTKKIGCIQSVNRQIT